MGQRESFAEALAAVEVGVWSWDIPSDTIVWSREMRRLFDVGDDAPVGYDAYLSLIPVEERAHVQAVIEGALREATETRTSQAYVIEHRLLLSSGETRWIEGRGRVFVDADGRPVRITGTAADATARKATEERLRKSEELHRMFSELTSDYVYVVDFLNPTLFPEIVAGSFERTTRLTVADIQAKGGWMAIIHPDDLPGLGTMQAELVHGRPSVNEYRITDGSGQLRWLRDSVRPVLDATGRVVKLMGGVQDITERKHLEEQLAQAQKLAAVARLSGGIAHDFNNLLSVVMGSVAVLESEVRTEEGRESCSAIMEAATRGAELTKSLLVFARRDLGSPELVDLGQVIRNAMPMLSRAVGPAVALRVSGDQSELPVRIDPGQAQLLLLNLAVNARDAMPSGGTLRIELASGTFGPQDGLPIELAPGPWVRLSVADDGTGIPPEVLPLVFEPFFTTKQAGKGTGLGLAACHGIVRAANGSIQVSSALGRGSTFTIHLPRVGQALAAPAVTRARYSPGGTERILLVEDEKPLQAIFARALRDRGYTVQCAESAESALTILSTQTFALLLSDVVLPGARGTEFVRQARERWPAMRALLMSGYAGATGIPEGVPLLAKPFTVERLATQIRALLDVPS